MARVSCRVPQAFWRLIDKNCSAVAPQPKHHCSPRVKIFLSTTTTRTSKNQSLSTSWPLHSSPHYRPAACDLPSPRRMPRPWPTRCPASTSASRTYAVAWPNLPPNSTHSSNGGVSKFWRKGISSISISLSCKVRRNHSTQTRPNREP